MGLTVLLWQNCIAMVRDLHGGNLFCMRVPLNWLKDYIDTNLEAHEIASLDDGWARSTNLFMNRVEI